MERIDSHSGNSRFSQLSGNMRLGDVYYVSHKKIIANIIIPVQNRVTLISIRLAEQAKGIDAIRDFLPLSP